MPTLADVLALPDFFFPTHRIKKLGPPVSKAVRDSVNETLIPSFNRISREFRNKQIEVHCNYFLAGKFIFQDSGCLNGCCVLRADTIETKNDQENILRWLKAAYLDQRFFDERDVGRIYPVFLDGRDKHYKSQMQILRQLMELEDDYVPDKNESWAADESWAKKPEEVEYIRSAKKRWEVEKLRNPLDREINAKFETVYLKPMEQAIIETMKSSKTYLLFIPYFKALSNTCIFYKFSDGSEEAGPVVSKEVQNINDYRNLCIEYIHAKNLTGSLHEHVVIFRQLPLYRAVYQYGLPLQEIIDFNIEEVD